MGRAIALPDDWGVRAGSGAEPSPKLNFVNRNAKEAIWWHVFP